MDNRKFWIAKDKNAVRCRLFAHKPTRLNDCWTDGKHTNESSLLLDSTMYPNFKWEDEPFPVELNEVPSVDAIENVLTCIADYYPDVFRNGVQPEEFRRKQAQMIREYITMYYDYWLPMNERGVELPRTKHDAQDEEEVQEMQSDIDELERICNEMTDEEFLESYRESTKGMRDETKYDDVFSERPCVMENKYTKPKTEEEVTNSKKTMGCYVIYCTEEQTKKALELGAPIEVIYTKDDYQQKRPTISIKGEFVDYDYFIPTAEEMIGWLEKQGILVLIDPSQDKFYGTYCLKREDGSWFNRIFLEGLYPSRKEAVIATIDAVLEHLKENKK